jgi:hypothetical protein
MLKAFVLEAPEFHMSIDQAAVYDQRPFRSMLIRGWVVYVRGKGFKVTRAGRDAWHEFQTTEIFRRNPNGSLTSYFDPTAYGLKADTAAHPRAKVA